MKAGTLRVNRDLCPFCKGVRHSMHFGGSGAFTTVLNPDYEIYQKGPVEIGSTFTGEFYVCAACNGTGRADVAAARVLDGTLDAIRAEIKRRNTCSVFIDGSFGGL